MDFLVQEFDMVLDAFKTKFTIEGSVGMFSGFY